MKQMYFSACGKLISIDEMKKESLLPMSAEQKIIVDYVTNGKNVRVIAYAGCGKTTLALLTAKFNPMKTFLLLTYNRKLCDDTKEKIKEWGLSNLICRTYHSHAGHSVNPRMQIHDDTRLFNMIMAVESGDCVVNYTQVDCIMLDESQDMNKDHYRMLCLVLQQNAYQFMILGDPRQQVYHFQGADTKYLLCCREYFHHLSCCKEWEDTKLTISYRMTPNICAFVNFLWSIDAIPGNAGPNPPVQYWYLYPYGTELKERVSNLIDEHGEENVAIITPLNIDKEGRNDPTKYLVNLLTKKYNFHLNTENCSYKNKVRVWTREGCKGSTIPVVIVMGFDARGGKQPDVNKMGVAASRASKLLIVVHGSSCDHDLHRRLVPHPYLYPFNNDVITEMKKAGTIMAPLGIPNDNFVHETKPQDFLRVTDITHNSAMMLRELLSFGDCTLITPKSEPLKLTRHRKFNRNGKELDQDLSSILGTAVPFQLQFEHNDSIKEIEAMLNPLVLPDDSKGPIRSIMELFDYLESGTENGESVYLTNREKRRIQSGLPTKLTWAIVIKWLKNHRNEIPSLQAFGFINKNRYDKMFREHYLEDVKMRYFQRPLLPADFMFLASASCAFEGSHHAYNQIGHDFTFIEEDAFSEAASYLQSTFETDQIEFEKPTNVALNAAVESPHKMYDHFVGRIDAVEYCEDAVKLHEFKVVSALSDEHKVQSLLYAALYCEENHMLSCTTVLTNAMTGEQYELSITREVAQQFIQRAAMTKT